MLFKKSKKIILNIDGIINENNENKIKTTLENLVDVSKAKVNLNKKCIIISYDNTIDEFLLTKELEKLGYIVTGIKNVK